MLYLLAAVEPDLSTYFAEFAKQIPWATPLLWIVFDQRKRIQVLEEKLQGANDKLQDDVIPLLTRLADMIPALLSKLNK